MTDRELEHRLASALEHAAPDDLDGILSRCGPGKGNVINMTNAGKKNQTHWRRWLVAAVFALVLFAGGGIFYQQALAVTSVVSLDVNPSIELRVNRNEKVLSCAAMNTDAEAVLADMGGGADLKGTKLDVAVNAIVGALVRQGYLDSLSSAILISVEDDNENRGARIREELVQVVDGVLQNASNQSAVLSQSLTLDTGLESRAKENQISTGKAYLIDQITTMNSTLEFDRLAGLSVEELRDLIQIGAPQMPIGKEAAQSAVLAYASVTSTPNSRNIEVDPELDEPVPCYEVELTIPGMGEFDYRVDAFTGEVLSGQKGIGEKNPVTPSETTPSTSNQESAEVQKPSDSGNSAPTQKPSDSGSSAPTQKPSDSGSSAPAQKPSDSGSSAETTVPTEQSAGSTTSATDAVTPSDGNSTTGRPSDESTPPVDNTPTQPAVTDIGSDAAIATALQHAGLGQADVVGLHCDRDQDDGRLEYEVEFKSGGWEYEYTIDAATGTILEHDADFDD